MVDYVVQLDSPLWQSSTNKVLSKIYFWRQHYLSFSSQFLSKDPQLNLLFRNWKSRRNQLRYVKHKSESAFVLIFDFSGKTFVSWCKWKDNWFCHGWSSFCCGSFVKIYCFRSNCAIRFELCEEMAGKYWIITAYKKVR